MQAEANIVERITRAYVAYRGVRVLCALTVLLSAFLLFVLAGGFPPYAWRLLAQALPQLPTLLAARGAAVLLALVGVLLLSLTQLIAWGVLLWLSWRMLAYWRYERQELRNFAADLEEAQYQAEEMDEQEESEEAEPALRSAGRTGGGQSYPPATRRRVIYPLSPLPSQMHDDDYLEQDETDPEDEEPFFLDEEEEETAMEIYRDEEEDDESASVWEEPQFASVPRMPATGTASSMQPVQMDSAPVYDQQIIEHASPIPVSAPGKYPDAIQHSRYGRILPFSAAPSAGALPHLTSTLYNHVPLPRSVSARPASESSAPGQPAGPANQPGVSQRTVPTQQGGPMQQARPADQLAAPPRQMPEQATKQQSAPRAVPPQPTSQPPQRIAPSHPSKPRLVPHRPTAPLATPAQAQPGMQARPTKQLDALPVQRPVPEWPTQPFAPQTSALSVNPPAAPQTSALSVNPPAASVKQQSAMQSLVELISTVPMVPPTRVPIHLPKPLVRTEAAARQSETQLVVSTGLDVGLKRRGKPNEDSLLALQNTRILRGGSCPVGLFVVADGMGGHENGQEASHLVIQSLSKTVVPSIIYGPTDDNYSELLAEGVHHANLEVYQRNRQTKVDMGTTIVAALVVDTTAYIVSAGDSRVYLYRAASGLTQVTRDHSTVARLVESGLLKPEDVYTHPRRNEIYRSLGHHPSEDLDKFILALQPDDVLLLCSDGLWEMVRDAHIQEIIASTVDQPAQTSAALVQAALDGGGKDNISVIVVYVKAAQGAQTAWAG